MERNLRLNKSQYIFLNELDTKFRAYVGGFGSGKTYVGCLDLLLFMKEHPNVTQGYFAPTYADISDIFYPTLEEAADGFGWTIETKRKDAYIYNESGAKIGHVMCRSMDRPESIVGFKIARALVDEIDTLATDKAIKAWRKIIARMRLVIPGVINGIGVTCTPEGFLFVHEHFKKNPSESYSMVQASTYENLEYLPPDYIDSLLESYPAKLVEAYVMGDFVNLSDGSVYYNFDRDMHNTHYIPTLREPLHIGMDFNVYKMAAIIHVIRDGIPYAVDEFVGYRDTPDIIDAIKDKYEGHNISVYPDASGESGSSKCATESDLSILRAAKFTVKAKSANPRIKNRVQSVNKKFEDKTYFVNCERCPNYAEALEQQVYARDGKPDKTSDLDHPVDAGGYFIHYKWPIRRKAFIQKQAGGM